MLEWFCPIHLIHLIGQKSLHFEKTRSTMRKLTFTFYSGWKVCRLSDKYYYDWYFSIHSEIFSTDLDAHHPLETSKYSKDNSSKPGARLYNPNLPSAFAENIAKLLSKNRKYKQPMYSIMEHWMIYQPQTKMSLMFEQATAFQMDFLDSYKKGEKNRFPITNWV